MKRVALLSLLLLSGCGDDIGESLVMTTIEFSYKCQHDGKTEIQCKAEAKRLIQEIK